ncbi:MAG: AAA family ATPase [Pseudomonadota bacterium]|nr:AAA family ATPase [Pseudomonadota bacterium]
MSISKELLEWSQTRPKWQQDALRRFAVRQVFSPEDEREVLAILKAAHGVSQTNVAEAKPLEAKHLPESAGNEGPVQLASIGNIENANRLAKGQVLHFAVNGLTTIYGDNGSGKSGYVRIIKQVCRTREADSVLPDVFKAGGALIPTAEVRYRLSPTATELKLEKWSSGREFAAPLSQLSVFDSRIASISLDKENELEFVPFGLDILDKLGELCVRFKDKLTHERNIIAKNIAEKHIVFGDDFVIQEVLDKITAKTSDDALSKLSSWSEVDADRLVEVGLLLNDPINQAKMLRARKTRCDAALNKVKAALVVLNEVAESQLRIKIAESLAAKEAVRMMSIDSFSEEPLPGVGSESWRVMYEAARSFSLNTAYSGREFPASRAGDLCVLCHQQLDDEARERLDRFEAFVKADVEVRAATAKIALEQLLTGIDVVLAGLVSLEEEVASFDPADSVWCADLLKAARSLMDRGRVVQAAISDGDLSNLPAMPLFNLNEAEKWSAELEAQALIHDAALVPAKKVELSREQANLKAREAFSNNKATLKALRDLLIQDRAYEKCLKAVAPNTITSQLRKMNEAHVQGALQAKLVEELGALRLSSIPINLGFKVAKAKSRHRVQLDSVVAAAKVKEVVSEGEYRALALACFLAQVRQQSDAAGIIVDDPVSSLDHDRRELVAERLVEEARRRQVIVFTHDLVFFFMLREAAAKFQTPFEGRNLYRSSGGFGTVDPLEPWKAKTLGQRLDTLEKVDFKNIEKSYPIGGAEYEKNVRFFCDRLRESWERLIEEGIFNETVVRFNPAVKTLRLDEVDLSDEIADHVYWGMTKISNWTAHDPAAAKSLVMPTPEELKENILAIRDCEAKIKEKRKAALIRRKQMREPPKAIILQ